MKLKNLSLYLAAGIFALPGTRTNAQAKKPPPAAQQAAQLPDDEVNPPEVSEADKKAVTVEVRDSYYVRSPSYSTEPIDSANPPYVQRLSETGISSLRNIDWILFGFEQRTRGFLKLEFGWFRLMTEVQDSRRTPIATGADTRDFNSVEPIQAYAELHFKNLFGYNRPLTVRGGRYSLELGDRRLVALNEWRNTTNTFQGGWILIGKKENNWDLNLIGAQPLVREIERLDQAIGQQWFYGGILSIRHRSEWVTFQPFYFGLNLVSTN